MKYLAALALGTALSAPAFAGGLVEPVEEPILIAAAPNGDWTGFYVGGQLGYGNVDTSVTGVDGDGLLGGLHLGYRYDWGTFVGGVELAYDWANIDLDTTPAEVDNIAALKLIGGYDMGNSLIYATVGAAHGKIKAPGASASDNGWLIGAGWDYQFTSNWILGTEVTYSKFNDFGNSGNDVDSFAVKVKASYRF
ncbi:MAG: outer membrane protein [Pseudorhodobacter sp.]